MKRVISIILATVLLLSALTLSGCSMPKLTLGGTPKTAATVGDTTITTGEYLAYLFNNFYNAYYNQGLYQYADYGYDVWEQEFPYGEGDDAKSLKFNEYLTEMTKDTIIRQVAAEQLLKKYELKMDEEQEKLIAEDMESFEPGEYLTIGIGDEAFKSVYRKLNLNEYSLMYGLYGEKGKKPVSETARKKYFDDNYLSYKILSVNMTDNDGAELDEKGQKEITDQLGTYLEMYNKDKNFEKVVDAYNKAEAGSESTDEQNRVDADATQMDENLAKAVRSVEVGTAKVVTYSADGTTKTAALILRLDPNSKENLFKDSTNNIIYAMKYEELDKELQEVIDNLYVKFNNKVIKSCNAKNFLA